MYSAIAANKRNTVLIMLVFIVVLAGLGWGVSVFYGEPTILYYVSVGALIYAVIQYFIASKLALAITGASQSKSVTTRGCTGSLKISALLPACQRRKYT